jgi:hypothetical protein
VAQSQGVATGSSDNATYIVFDAPNASSTTVTGINDAGDVVGYFLDSQTNTTRGFARGHDGNIIVFDAATAGATPKSTQPVAVNAAGDVAGIVYDARRPFFHSFFRDAQGDITVFDVSQCAICHIYTLAVAINNSDVITGYTQDEFGSLHTGFARDAQGNIMAFAPIPKGSQPTSINERGDIAGVTSPGFHVDRGFVRDPDGVITVFQVPDILSDVEAWPVAINNRGNVVGYYIIRDAQGFATRGFVRDSKGNITTFDAGANASQTVPIGMNDSGEILGNFEDATGPHNFLLDPQGTATAFDVPGASGVNCIGINNRGDVAGTGNFNGQSRGFVRLANPSN